MDSTAALERIGTCVRETPLVRSRALSEASGARVYLKLENRQETGAFKLRGAANKLLSLPKEQAARGIVAASNGNHALAVATIGQKLGIPVEIFVSENLHPVKRSRIESLRARVHAVKGDALVAELTARGEAERSGRPYVSPYNDLEVIEGQGTLAVEMLRQLQALGEQALDAVFVAVGGGGLIGGIGSHLRQASPRTEVVGCWPENSAALHACLRAGEIVEIEDKPTWSTSTAGNVEPGTVTLDICERVIDRELLVSEDEILEAARRLYREDDQRIEGAAAVAVAGFLRTAREYAEKTVALVLCGGNADPAFENKVIQD
jgi:threonine dehydratase